MADLVLRALDGFNPMGWLAALGTLVALDQTRGTHDPRPRLSWSYTGTWTPALSDLPTSTGERDIVERLMADLHQVSKDPAFVGLEYKKDGKPDGAIQRDLKPPPGFFHAYLLGLRALGSRHSLDVAAAFATDVAVDKSKGNTKPTALHFTAGQQQFLQIADALADSIGPQDLDAALFSGWAYDREEKTFSWDASDYRDYALRADSPSTAAKYTVPGADWLALRGLTFLPCVPVGSAVLTTLCTGRGNRMAMHWPLWRPALSPEELRSLLFRGDLSKMSKQQRAARGILEVLQSRIARSDQGYGSFAPASP